MSKIRRNPSPAPETPGKRVLHGFLTGLAILFKACLLLPIPLFMIWFNYTVDMSGLFQGPLAPREIAAMMLKGETVSNYEKMDERQVLAAYTQNLSVEQVPDTLALGSSRVMQLNQQIVGSSFFNGGVSGAGIMDIMNIWYLFERADRLPRNLILCVDPWLFNGAAASELNKKADSKLFAEFLERSLGRVSDYQPPDQAALWKALIDPSYFQGNVAHYRKQKKNGSLLTEDGQALPFHPVTGSTEDLEYAVKLPDGSILYPRSFRSWTQDEVLQEALAQAGTLSSMHGFSAMEPYWTELFTDFIGHVQSKGVNVVFLLTPYHPFICLHTARNPQGLEGFFQVEPWLRDFAASRHIPLYGSYHPGRVGIPEALFFDGIHCKADSLPLMMPPIRQAIENRRTRYEELYLSRYGSTMNSDHAQIGTDENTVVVEEAWFIQAQAENNEQRSEFLTIPAAS